MGLRKGFSNNKIKTVDNYTFQFDPINNPNHIYLQGYTSSTSNLCTLRQPGASAGYQVGVGKSLKVVAIRSTNRAAGAASQVWAQSDNDVGLASTTALTNPSYFMDSSVGMPTGQATSGVRSEIAPIGFSVAPSKYLSVNDGDNTNSSFFEAWCVLV